MQQLHPYRASTIAAVTAAAWPSFGSTPEKKELKAMKTKIHSKTLAIAAAVILGIASTGQGSAVARGAHGGGGFGMQLISAPSNPVPQFNASSPYTVTPSRPRPPCLRQVLDQCFTETILGPPDKARNR